MHFLGCKGLSNDDIDVAGGTVFQEIRPGGWFQKRLHSSQKSWGGCRSKIPPLRPNQRVEHPCTVGWLSPIGFASKKVESDERTHGWPGHKNRIPTASTKKRSGSGIIPTTSWRSSGEKKMPTKGPPPAYVASRVLSPGGKKTNIYLLYIGQFLAGSPKTRVLVVL